MFLKSQVRQQLIHSIQDKVNALMEEMNRIAEDLRGDSKNTAGDKHETSRAMLHLEQERIASQLTPLEQMLTALSSFQTKDTHEEIRQGSLFQLNGDWFYLSVGFGKITIENTNVFCLSTSTPLGKILLGHKTGEAVQFNGKNFRIDSVC